jgi:hypothetical protein
MASLSIVPNHSDNSRPRVLGWRRSLAARNTCSTAPDGPIAMPERCPNGTMVTVAYRAITVKHLSRDDIRSASVKTRRKRALDRHGTRARVGAAI